METLQLTTQRLKNTSILDESSFTLSMKYLLKFKHHTTYSFTWRSKLLELASEKLPSDLLIFPFFLAPLPTAWNNKIKNR